MFLRENMHTPVELAKLPCLAALCVCLDLLYVEPFTPHQSHHISLADIFD